MSVIGISNYNYNIFIFLLFFYFWDYIERHCGITLKFDDGLLERVLVRTNRFSINHHSSVSMIQNVSRRQTRSVQYNLFLNNYI